MTKTVLVCEAQVPFVQGGAELLVRGLLAELARGGYRTKRCRSRLRRARIVGEPRDHGAWLMIHG